ncbi:MAG TPA: type I-A CRISPR-associated protein Cas5a [Sulfolobales archaeon]|nr:type I-A CRISPR-associated protein Cas5a [Sulfolobales archaeon]
MKPPPGAEDLEALVVRVRFLWGFSIRRPSVSKAQPSYSTIPPTTLIGALSAPIAVSKKYGEVVARGRSIYSASTIAMDFVATASLAFEERRGRAPVGIYWEDLNRYAIHQFQRRERRAEREYMFGAIGVGKIYAPDAIAKIVYVIDMAKARSVLGDTWRNDLIRYAYQITRIGSKESLVAVENAKLSRVEPVGREFCTSLYQPLEYLERLESPYNPGIPYYARCPGSEKVPEAYIETFWEESFEFGVQPGEKLYLVPGTRSPIMPGEIRVRVGQGYQGYEVEGEKGLVIALPERSSAGLRRGG